MRRLLILLLSVFVLLSLAACGGGVGLDAEFASTLTPATGVTSSATGSATAALTGDTLEVEGSFDGLSSALTEVAGSSAHVHDATAGGAIVFGLTVNSDPDELGGTFSGSGTLTAEQTTALMNGDLYVNIHTVANTDGEIRGFLVEAE